MEKKRNLALLAFLLKYLFFFFKGKVGDKITGNKKFKYQNKAFFFFKIQNIFQSKNLKISKKSLLVITKIQSVSFGVQYITSEVYKQYY